MNDLRTKRGIPSDATEINIEDFGIKKCAAVVYLWQQIHTKTGKIFFVAKTFSPKQRSSSEFLLFRYNLSNNFKIIRAVILLMKFLDKFNFVYSFSMLGMRLISCAKYSK